jgi:subtilisin family serine protease
MCDTVAGQLIISFAKVDSAAHQLIEDIRKETIGHVSYIESLDDRLHSLDLELPEEFPFEFHLVAVPAGSEVWKANYLQFFYRIKLLNSRDMFQTGSPFFEAMWRSNMQFSVGPNFLLSLARPPVAGSFVSALDFAFDPLHQTYRSMIGIPAEARAGRGIRIAVLDSGIARDYPGKFTGRNFVDPKLRDVVDDDHGHGTVVSLIIHDLVPEAELVVYKVANANGDATEWDTLAALVACGDVHVANLSLTFGLRNRHCRVCGRESHSSRSAVFENTIEQHTSALLGPIFVAAAGNNADPELAYPARFGQVIAVGAITSAAALSSKSNFGDRDHFDGPHDNHFVMPGGEPNGANAESVGSFASRGEPWWGTSMAAAYATGVAASIAERLGYGVTPAEVLRTLRHEASTVNLPSNDTQRFGHGLMRAS